MKFCDCGGLVGPDAKCRLCGKKFSEGSGEIKLSETLEKKKVHVIEDNKIPLPEIDAHCDKCENKKAFFWVIQTRSSDEPPTQFFRCTKCKYTWREYK